jgi:acyl-coenzyme A synthetase/AMP-(fatty) acid ligase
VLHGHDDVVDCAVFGVPDEAAGEIVVAAVQLAPDATSTEADLRALVIDRLASYKQVSRLEFVDEIPRLPSGKVLRRTLRERYSGDQGE